MIILYFVAFFTGAIIGVVTMALMTASKDTHYHDVWRLMKAKEDELLKSWEETSDYREMYKSDGVKIARKILEDTY